MAARFCKLLSQRDELRHVSLTRMLWSDGVSNCKVTLHVFCDASKSIYGCAHYLVKHNSSTTLSDDALLFSKVRLAPRKQKPVNQLEGKTTRPLSAKPLKKAKIAPVGATPAVETRSIPQLELLGVVLGVRSTQLIISLLKDKNIPVDGVYIWIDATTVLQWLHSPSILPVFIENRIREIQETPNLIIRYVPSKDNPADIVTNGKTAVELKVNQLWWNGPDWLIEEKLWPEPPPTTTSYSTVKPNLLVTLFTAKQTGSTSLLSDALEKQYLHWDSLVQAFS